MECDVRALSPILVLFNEHANIIARFLLNLSSRIARKVEVKKEILLLTYMYRSATR